MVCENYHRFFDGKNSFEAGDVRVRGTYNAHFGSYTLTAASVLDPVDTTGLAAGDVNDLTTRVRENMLSELQKMDAELDRGDVTAAQYGRPQKPYLGGIAKLASYLVGQGHGPDVAKRAAKQRKQMVKPGTSGENPQDFGLVSEKGKGKSTAVDEHSADDLRERAGSQEQKMSSSHSSEETDESAVFVNRP